MSLRINHFSLNKSYSDNSWVATAHYSHADGGGHVRLPEEVVSTIMATIISSVNAALPALADNLSKAALPELPPPPASIAEADFTEVPEDFTEVPEEGVGF